MSEITIQLSQALQRRLDEAVERVNCSDSEWVIAAVEWSIEQDEEGQTPLLTRSTRRSRSLHSCRTAF
jgi:metal-responsive CopG/Arc/MetJ family transcriptional regulator